MPKSSGARHELLAQDEWQSWNALLMTNRLVLRDLDADLRAKHGFGVSDFDVLITLHNAPENRLRMSELAERVMLSPAGLTHLVTRLERDRLLRREIDSHDGRRWFAVLTADGSRALRAARITHNAVLRRTILAVTTAADRRTLRALWSRLSG